MTRFVVVGLLTLFLVSQPAIATPKVDAKFIDKVEEIVEFGQRVMKLRNRVTRRTGKEYPNGIIDEKNLTRANAEASLSMLTMPLNKVLELPEEYHHGGEEVLQEYFTNRMKVIFEITLPRLLAYFEKLEKKYRVASDADTEQAEQLAKLLKEYWVSRLYQYPDKGPSSRLEATAEKMYKHISRGQSWRAYRKARSVRDQHHSLSAE